MRKVRSFALAAACVVLLGACGQWTVVGSPNPTSASNPSDADLLTQASCPNPSFCVAVGYLDTEYGYQPIIESGPANSLSADTVPNVARGSLADVSCATTSFCVAVGDQAGATTGPYQPLIESWNAHAWSILPSAISSPYATVLNAVSCSSASSCFAVGDEYLDNGVVQTLIESWNGTAWTVSPSVDTSATDQDQLMGVSCISVDRCMAVGNYVAPGQPPQTLIESYDGKTWSIVSSPNVPKNDWLSSVSCTSASFCVAVGSYSDPVNPSNPTRVVYGATLVESFDSGSWSIMSSPNASGQDSLSGVSCIVAQICVAVGTEDLNSGSGTAQTLVEQLVGSWTIRTSADTSIDDEDELMGVSCASITVCLAVGNYAVRGPSVRTLALALTGLETG